MGNFYDLLGVRPDATVDQIDKAYRDLAVKLHPDKNPADADAAKRRFQQLQQAYETLINAERRFYYNADHCRLKSGWFFVPVDAPFREMEFNRDGSFALQTTRFRAEDPVNGTVTFLGNGAVGTITKAPGVGEELVLSGPGIMERFRFHNLKWFCWTPVEAASRAKTEASAAKQQHTSAQRGISTIVYTSNDVPPPPPQHGQRKSSPKRRIVRWTATAAALFMAIGTGWALNGLRHRGANPGTLEDRQMAADERAKRFEIDEQERQQRERELAASRAAEQAEAGRKMDAARNRDRLLALVRRGDETLKLHDELVSETQAWQEAIPPLLTNDDGRKLATHPDYVRTFMVEYRKRRPSGDALAALRVEIEKLLAPLREAAADEDPVYSPPRDIDTALDQKRSEIDKAISEYSTSRSLISALIASTTERAAKTLTVAIDELVKADELERAQRIAQESAEARRKLDQLEADNARKKTEAELAHQTELARAADEERAKIAQKEQDRHDAESRQVRAALGFFVAKDFLQPTRGPGYNGMEQTGKSGPISFSRLESCGALSQDRKGLQTLLWIVTNTWDKSRPTWGVSPHLDQLSATDMQKLSQAQDYLNRLGPTLVELGMLAE